MINVSQFALRVEVGRVISEFNQWLLLLGPGERVQYGEQSLIYRGVVVAAWVEEGSMPARGWAALINETQLLTVCTDNEDETLEALLAQIDDALPKDVN